MIETSNKVIFHTHTDIDPKSWELMGISAKDSDNPIGCFGTGMKYAIAVFLRLGHKVSIKTEGKLYEFETKAMEFRGKGFEQIVCNGKELSFTTEYGKLWEPWQAYRELVSNTIDEGGLHFRGEPMEQGSSIIVEGDKVVECLNKHEDYFVGSREPIAETSAIRIYEGNGTVFYRGVKVGTAGANASFSYEILEALSLTEDRTILGTGTISSKLGLAVVRNLKDKALIRRFMTLPQEKWEYAVDYNWSNWSPEFKEVVVDLWKNNPTKLNKHVFREVRKQVEDIGWDTREPDDDQDMMLEKAKSFLEKSGYKVEAPVFLVTNEDQNNIAFTFQEKIYLTDKAFDKGMFYLVRVLMEEHFHTEGHDDNSRCFEQFLMEQLVKSHSKRLREPL